MEQEKYHVISPDGLPITDGPFENREAALEYIPIWRDRLRQQGYYAAVGKRIPLDELAGRLTIIPESQALEVMADMFDRVANREKPELEQLLDKADDHVRMQMAKLGKFSPTLFMFGPGGGSAFAWDGMTNKDKQEFLEVGRMMCVAKGAEVAILCANGVTTARHDDNQKGEILMLSAESRDEDIMRILPVERSKSGELLGFGREAESRNKAIGQDLHRLVPTEEPDEVMRRKAEEYLAQMNRRSRDPKRDRGFGRMR